MEQRRRPIQQGGKVAPGSSAEPGDMVNRVPVCESTVDEQVTAEGWALSHPFMASMCLIRKLSLQRSNCDGFAGFLKTGVTLDRHSEACFVMNTVSVCTVQTCRRG
jgi:hypothetical protein